MTAMTWMYHKDYAPEGRQFDENATPLTLLAAEGWVDSPAKIGVDVWHHNGSREAVEKMASHFRNGMVPAVDDVHTPSTAYLDEMARKQKQIEALMAELEAIKQQPSIEQQTREAAEKLADLRSDAEKLMDAQRRQEHDPSQAEQQIIEQANETMVEQGQDAAAVAKEQADLAAQAGNPVAATDL